MPCDRVASNPATRPDPHSGLKFQSSLWAEVKRGTRESRSVPSHASILLFYDRVVYMYALLITAPEFLH